MLAFDAAGRVVRNLQDPSGRLADTTSARRFGDDVFGGSLSAGELGRVTLKG